MKIIDGKLISTLIKDELRVKVSQAAERYGRKPALAVIIVGENPASQVYVRNKVRACGYVGMDSTLIAMDESVSEDELLLKIAELNADKNLDGILVQLPLPGHINESKVIEAIDRTKDVDGFHPLNVADLWIGNKTILPCTPKGIIELIDRSGVEIAGKKAVVIGRSNIVGKPVAKLLLDRNATVTIAHSRTPDLAKVASEADILVAAVGRANLVTAGFVKPGATVIDVGINRLENGKLCGDVDFESVSAVAGYLTPVPGGVGPMTIAMLMQNTLECFIRRFE